MKESEMNENEPLWWTALKALVAFVIFWFFIVVVFSVELK
jgi:hypothetical protein